MCHNCSLFYYMDFVCRTSQWCVCLVALVTLLAPPPAWRVSSLSLRAQHTSLLNHLPPTPLYPIQCSSVRSAAVATWCVGGVAESMCLMQGSATGAAVRCVGWAWLWHSFKCMLSNLLIVCFKNVTVSSGLNITRRALVYDIILVTKCVITHNVAIIWKYQLKTLKSYYIWIFYLHVLVVFVLVVCVCFFFCMCVFFLFFCLLSLEKVKYLSQYDNNSTII